MVVSHIPQSDVEDSLCFVFNSGCEENIDDTSRTGAGLERDGSPQPAPLLAESDIWAQCLLQH